MSMSIGDITNHLQCFFKLHLSPVDVCVLPCLTYLVHTLGQLWNLLQGNICGSLDIKNIQTGPAA